MTSGAKEGPRVWTREERVLWLGVFTGPVAYAVDLLVSYAVVSFTAAEEKGQRPVLWVITALSLTSTLLAFAVSLRAYRRMGASAPERRRFMALGGAMMSAFFAVVLVAHAIPKVLLRMGE
jgi:hypothetical protein